ncbi:DUF11 domain-containing protein [Candidatus Gracilibacteria bacterium]|nr:DUF11 domain-containing protein [Candidatus Gracilibacteria bacterium]
MGPKPRLYRRLMLLIVVLMAMSGLVPARAADPLPPPLTPLEEISSGEATPFTGTGFVGADERAEELRLARAAETTAAPTVEPFVAEPQQIQGDVRLDVSIGPARIRGGDEFFYTFTFTNTNAAPVSGVVIRAIWNNANPINASNFMQYCSVGGCPPQGISGGVSFATGTPQVNRTSRSFSVDYTLNEALGPGAAASFQIAMRTRLQDDLRFLPRSNVEPVRPAGSGELYKDSNLNNKISEDTASNLVEGPVLVLSKAVTATNSGYNNQIFPTQEVEYTITVGNATGAQDRPNGVVRSDAIDATNLLLTDIFPAAIGGSEYISSDPPATVDLENEKMSWTIDRLRVGEQREFKVRFRKTDISKGCKRLENAFYTITSDEMPLRTGIERYNVKGAKVGITVLPPLRIKSISAEPDNLPYGSFTTLTIVAQNLFPKAIVDGRLNYFMQDNAFFQSAAPQPLVNPEIDGNGLLSWRLDMQPARRQHRARRRSPFRSKALTPKS